MEAAASGVSARRATAVPRKDVALSAIAAVSWALTGMAGTAALGLRLPSATTAGDVSAFSLKGADLHTTVEITPLGGSLVSALLFSWFFLRSLRTAGVVVAPAELLTHAGTVVVLLAPLPAGRAGSGKGGGAAGVRGLDGTGGPLPERIGPLVHAKISVGFTVDTVAASLDGAGRRACGLLITLPAALPFRPVGPPCTGWYGRRSRPSSPCCW
ncbi:streptophobe family protein [Streptomyces sp. CG4]|uniref:streptophobe family protein n=1 Tax=Streptomyces sp. CG4 TaxID=408783 RepID=UPI0034E28300